MEQPQSLAPVGRRVTAGRAVAAAAAPDRLRRPTAVVTAVETAEKWPVSGRPAAMVASPSRESRLLAPATAAATGGSTPPGPDSAAATGGTCRSHCWKKTATNSAAEAELVPGLGLRSFAVSRTGLPAERGPEAIEATHGGHQTGAATCLYSPCTAPWVGHHGPSTNQQFKTA